MSFFSWLSNKPTTVKTLSHPIGVQRMAAPAPSAAAVTPSPSVPAAPGMATTQPSVERKVRRHARREQLYVAIRESMTRAGLLSASYRFKVLSLDQNGNQFLVMMDIAAELTTSAEKLSHTEKILVQAAKAGYGITVTAVYWRVDVKAPPKAQVPAAQETQAPPMTQVEPLAQQEVDAFEKTHANTVWVHEKPHHDPLLEAEVAAFKRALAASPTPALIATRPERMLAAAIAVPVADQAGRARAAAVTSYALITGFEDTEVPDASAVPALSATQYGELN